MSDTQINYTALTIRDTNAHLGSTVDGIASLRNQKQILCSVVSTLNKACTVQLLGTLANDPTMTNPVVDTEVAVGIGSGTTQVVAMQTDALWQYADVRVTAGDTPTAGTVVIALFAPKERR